MSASRNLARRAVRHLAQRLERLHEALQSLGRRLRESIAQLIGSHAGETIREAIHALLESLIPRPQGRDPPLREPYRPDPYRPDRDREDRDHDDPYRADRYRTDPAGNDPYGPGWQDDPGGHDDWGRGYGMTSTPAIPDRSLPPDGLPPWCALLPPTLQLPVWCLRKLPCSPRLLGAIGVGAAAAITAVAAGPLAGAITATAGAIALLTLADGVTDTAGELATSLNR
jgi:hypothetical protein